MATARTHIPIELYLHSDYEPDAEYVDGVIEERPGGEWDHATWQQAVQRWFLAHGAEWGVRVRPELRVRVAKTRFRVPDVTVLDSGREIEQIITDPPLAVFEILSPDDTLTRILRKLGDYQAMGIEQIWVIDPETKQTYRYVEGALSPARYFGGPGERIYFAMSEIKAFLDYLGEVEPAAPRDARNEL